MTGTCLLIEAGLLETRAAWIVNDVVSGLWFGPAVDETGETRELRTGRIYTGAVAAIDKSLNAAFVDLGRGHQGFLPLSAQSPPVCEGARISVRVESPPRQQKKARLRLCEPQAPASEIGPDPANPHILEEAVMWFGGRADEVIVDRADAKAIFARHKPALPVAIAGSDIALFPDHGVDEALEKASARRLTLSGGGSLIFDETEALTAIDIDSGGLSASSPLRHREKLIEKAAHEIHRQIQMRNLGGRIAIDFPSIKERNAQTRISEKLKSQFTSLAGVSSISITRGNFLMLTIERRGLSLWETVTEATDDDPVPGRRFTTDWLARGVVRQVEWRLARGASRPLEIHAGAFVFDTLVNHYDIAEKVFGRYGARIDLVLNESADPRHAQVMEKN